MKICHSKSGSTYYPRYSEKDLELYKYRGKVQKIQEPDNFRGPTWLN